MDNWNRRSKRERKCYLNSLGSLYGDDVSPPMPMLPPKRKRGVKRKYVESQHQQALVAWMRRIHLRFTKIHNEGAMSRLQGARLNAEGRERFMPDLFLCHMAKGKGGFFIEMKRPGEKPNAGQLEMMKLLREQGYHAEWYDDWELAKQAICEYLGRHM